jgi:hypothetical protein
LQSETPKTSPSEAFQGRRERKKEEREEKNKKKEEREGASSKKSLEFQKGAAMR